MKTAIRFFVYDFYKHFINLVMVSRDDFNKLICAWSKRMYDINVIRNPSFFWKVEDWSILKVDSLLALGETEEYLQIIVEYISPKAAYYQGLTTEDCDENLSLDGAAEVNPDGQRYRWHGKLDIILHPIYHVPHPYLQVYDYKGESIDISEVQQAIDEFLEVEECNSPRCGLSKAIHVGEKESTGSRLFQDEHPFTSSPCMSLHLCELPSLLNVIMKDLNGTRQDSIGDAIKAENFPGEFCSRHKSLDNVLTEENENENRHAYAEENRNHHNIPISHNFKDLYLLHWFVVVGPSIGLKISPSMFEHIRQLLE